jgi:hypothetical protein
VQLRIPVLVAALVSVLALVGAPPTLADSRISMDGVAASFQSWGEKFRLWDTKCDGNDDVNGPKGGDDPVYILYKRWNAKQRRLDYDGGCGTGTLFDLNFREGQIIDWKVCINAPWDFDRCSRSTRDRT